MSDYKDIFQKIANALLVDYTSVYYINAVTNAYEWFSTNKEHHSLCTEPSGTDFFRDMASAAEHLIYEEDKHIFTQDLRKENLLARMQHGTMQSMEYRLLIGGKPVWHTLRLIRGISSEEDYFILGVINIEKEMQLRQKTERLAHERKVYNQIAESLALQYDVIYYVDSASCAYTGYTSNAIYGNLEVKETGSDFFAECRKNVELLIHPHDKARIHGVLDHDFFLTTLGSHKQYSTDYRMIVNGKPQYTRMTIMWASDKKHYIIGVENVQAEVEREKEQIAKLNNANALARRDELTGTKNKTAYHELEEAVQRNMENGLEYLPYAIVVCDINDLKYVNDTFGHQAGDDYIRSASKMICDIFAHSPVFRIGGDEFVAFLGGNDYQRKAELFATLQKRILHNLETKDGPVIASGMAEYRQGEDARVTEVFERADQQMYENKKSLKARGSHA